MVGREISQQFPARSSSIGEERLRVKNIFLSDPSGAKQWTVEDASLTVHSGEILGIAGLHGSGKSEFLNGLFGSYGKTAKGEVYAG